MDSTNTNTQSRLDDLSAEMQAILGSAARDRRLGLTPAEEQRYARLQEEHSSLSMAIYLVNEQQRVMNMLERRAHA